jgi:hypothetical protein
VTPGGISAQGTSVLTPFYSYGIGGYSIAGVISPGHGTWVKVTQDGSLILTGGTVEVPAALASGGPAGGIFNAIQFEDASGRIRSLFVGAEPEGFCPASYELPPVPPEDALDIRFDNDAALVVHASRPKDHAEHAIRVQGVVYPLTIRGTVHGEENAEYVLAYTIQGKTREVKLGGNAAEATIGREAAGSLRLRIAPIAVPTEYALAQNFPNPFNPTTTIRFSLPRDGRVVLKLYNLLGQEVRSLLDQEMSAGERSVTLDASDLASGVYFYRLEAGQFSSTRKMVMLR